MQRLPVCALVFLVLGCGGETVAPYQPATGQEAAGLYWDLTLDHHAVTLSTVAPYDTIRLTATPRDARGAPLVGLGPVTYRLSDPDLAEVSADGLVRARSTGTEFVVVELVADGVQHTDQVTIRITDDSAPPALASLSIHPEPPDSTTWPVTGDGTSVSIGPDGSVHYLPIKLYMMRGATDSAGNTIPGLPIALTSSDQSVVSTVFAVGDNKVLMFPRTTGRTTIIASTTAYGVTAADTVEFTVTMPVFSVVQIDQRPAYLGGPMQFAFAPEEVTVSPGGNVVWVNMSGQPVDVVFDDTPNVAEHGAVSCANAGITDPGGTGNIAAFGELQDPQAPTLSAENCRSRSFPVPGVYAYHSALTGATGRVVVTTGPTTP